MNIYEYMLNNMGLEIDKDFGIALVQVFSQEYLVKIKNNLKKNITIKLKDFKDPGKVAYVEGKTIYVNSPVFETLSQKEKTEYLMHEFIHIMQNTKNFLILRTFKEVFNLGSSLFKIVRNEVIGTLGEFLTGENKKITNPKYEIISYLMNGKIDWTKITKEGKEQFVRQLVDSGLFNLRSGFWKERLM